MVLLNSKAQAQGRIWPMAHAHNDYLHKHPLTDALSRGFCSVEADVFLKKGELKLGHIKPKWSSTQTLQIKYLEPIQKRLIENQGRIHTNYSGIFYLMIDMKTEAEPGYVALNALLSKYPEIIENPSIVIFLSGRRPLQTMLADSTRCISADGRPSHLGQGYSPEFMPVISTNYRSLFKWNGNGEMPIEELTALKILADRVHAEGKKFRLWATPETTNCWDTLLDAGVDLINTDCLEELSDFLEKKYPQLPDEMGTNSPD
ncbi:MAG: hypothetical protein R2792_08615 [Saprospiraceae bacterium]